MGHEANQRIGPAIGLPELSVIEFDGKDLLDSVDTAGPARAAFDDTRSATPTPLCHVDPALGLRQANLAAVRSYANPAA